MPALKVVPWIITTLGAGAAIASSSSAQVATASPRQAAGLSHYESRGQLETAALNAERQHRRAEAFLLRSRLTNGDFREGDRIVVVLETSPRPDTLQVRAGAVLQIPGMGDLSLHGVLRSELDDSLRQHLARYLRNPNVRASSLLAVAVLGSVGNPGYHYVAADVLLRDVLMRAGGPAPNADLNKLVVKRGEETIWGPAGTRVALADGLSLDKLHLRAGDEVYVPERRRTQWSAILVALSSTIAVTSAIIGLSR